MSALSSNSDFSPPPDPLAYLPLVRAAAARAHLANSCVPEEDLFQEGFVGLLEACQSYRAHKSRFANWARLSVLWAISDYLEKHYRNALSQTCLLYDGESLQARQQYEPDLDLVDWLKVLTERERFVLELWSGKRGRALPCVQIGKQLGLSRSGVGAVLLGAIKKLRAQAGV